MNKINSLLLLILLTTLALTGCGENAPVIHDLSDSSFQLVNQDSSTVTFPADYEGTYLVIGFIYTHCPDICPVTTANMITAFDMLDETTNVQFIEITFDPERDTPSVLKDYMQRFELNSNKFTMLTGDSTAINPVLDKMGIVAQRSYPDSISQGSDNYFMIHSDRISIMDPQGRVRFEYPGSKVPPGHIVEDLNKLRGS